VTIAVRPASSTILVSYSAPIRLSDLTGSNTASSSDHAGTAQALQRVIVEAQSPTKDPVGVLSEQVCRNADASGHMQLANRRPDDSPGAGDKMLVGHERFPGQELRVGSAPWFIALIAPTGAPVCTNILFHFS
jgi:hypothetical protein